MLHLESPDTTLLSCKAGVNFLRVRCRCSERHNFVANLPSLMEPEGDQPRLHWALRLSAVVVRGGRVFGIP